MNIEGIFKAITLVQAENKLRYMINIGKLEDDETRNLAGRGFKVEEFSEGNYTFIGW
jgi:hypothetical protein